MTDVEQAFIKACDQINNITFYRDLRSRFASGSQWKEESELVDKAFRESVAEALAILIKHKVELLTSSDEGIRKLAADGLHYYKKLESQWSRNEDGEHNR